VVIIWATTGLEPETTEDNKSMFYLEGWGRKELIRRIEIQKRMKESIPSIFPSLVIFIFLFSNLNELIHILLLYYSSNNWLNELFFNSSTLLSMHPSSYPYIDVLIIYILLEDMYLFLEQSLKLSWWSTTLLWWHTTNCNSIHKWCGIQSSY
jgi:hypothetical protein